MAGRHDRFPDHGIRPHAVQPGIERPRPNNPFAFTVWLAGGGIKGGASYGASDEWSYQVAEKPVYCYDVHATVLRLLGIDHTRLTYRHNGIDRRLTDVYWQVLPELLS